MAKHDKAKQAEPEAPSTEDREPGGSDRRKLIILFAAAALLVAAGAAAAFLFLGGGVPEGGAEQAAPRPEGTYFVMEPELVVSLSPDSHYRSLQTKIGVYSSNEELLEQLKRHEPMVRHHLSDVFAARTSQELLGREGRERLKQDLKAEIEARLSQVGVGDAEIEDLYFTQFVME